MCLYLSLILLILINTRNPAFLRTLPSNLFIFIVIEYLIYFPRLLSKLHLLLFIGRNLAICLNLEMLILHLNQLLLDIYQRPLHMMGLMSEIFIALLYPKAVIVEFILRPALS